MFGARIYIEQQFKKPWYSEILYATSVVSGANSIINVDHTSDGASMIFISSFINSVQSGFAPTTFRDNFGRILFQSWGIFNGVAFFPSVVGQIDFFLIIKSGTLFITADANNDSYTVGYQYLREVDLKD